MSLNACKPANTSCIAWRNDDEEAVRCLATLDQTVSRAPIPATSCSSEANMRQMSELPTPPNSIVRNRFRVSATTVSWHMN